MATRLSAAVAGALLMVGAVGLRSAPQPRRGAHPTGAGLVGSVSLLQTRSTSRTGTRSDGHGSTGSANTPSGPQGVDVSFTIYVGTPPQELSVAIDTGSGNLLLPARQCRSLACLAHRPYDSSASSTFQLFSIDGNSSTLSEPQTVALHIGTGEGVGEIVHDRVCLDAAGQFCADTAFVQMQEMSQTSPFGHFAYDGILGLGLPSGSLDPHFNFVGNMVEAGLFKWDRFAIWLANQDDPEGNEVTFGQLNEARLGSEILWLPVSRPSTGMWQATLLDLALGGSRLGLCGHEGCQAAFDTGTSVIGGPSGLIDGLLSQLSVQEDCSNFNSLPVLGFEFGSYILGIEPRDYVRRTVAGQCHHQLLAVDIPPPKGPLFLLGSPFFRRYYAIFDRSQLKVGLSFSPHVPVDAAGETPESVADQAARLMVLTA